LSGKNNTNLMHDGIFQNMLKWEKQKKEGNLLAKPLRKLNREKIWGLIEVSKGKRPATTWIHGGELLNVYTGEVQKVNIALFEDRIAYVGEKEPQLSEQTVVIDASSNVLVPGYIEPHAHPFQLYNPKVLSEYALSRGTTTMVNDNLPFFLQLTEENLNTFMTYCSNFPLKNVWWARLDPQSNQPEASSLFSDERLLSLIQQDFVLQAGELTSWPQLLAGDEGMLEGMAAVRNAGKRVEGHNPGSSIHTLNAVAAAGVTACHEAIKAEEVINRLRLGMYATLRHSSIRPDVPELLQGLKRLNYDFSAASRIMFTTDGSTPPFLTHGFNDYLVKLALEEGLDPKDVYRMASLNPAVYYGLDQDVGGIAPGRLADILFLEDLHHPTPLKVMADGKMAAEKGKLIYPLPEYDWEGRGFASTSWEWKVQASWFDPPADIGEIPVIELLNAVITKQADESLPAERANQLEPGYCYASLLSKTGDSSTNAILKGFVHHLDALVCSYTPSQDILVLGQNKEIMAEAVNETAVKGGGILVKEGHETIFHLPLPLLDGMSKLPMPELIQETQKFWDLLKERGYSYLDPIYTLFFLSATHLPDLRISTKGIYSTKKKEFIYPSKRLF
jgi:adenine deaminase